jgi:hypothetical protein
MKKSDCVKGEKKGNHQITDMNTNRNATDEPTSNQKIHYI